MKTALWSIAWTVCGLLAGCSGSSTEPSRTDSAKTPAAAGKPNDEVKIQAALAQLDAGDRALAEAQKFCAVMNGSRLASMGKPVRLTVKDQPVFLCCKSCEKKAMADADKTLAKVSELKAKSGAPPD